ncbi:6051_t:CDS:2, partial [Entrophospora sp. SA101]
MDFYKLNEVEDWTCIKVVEHYRANSEQKDWKKVLDSIKKDLKKVKESTSGFDTTRKRKAQRIVDNWKDWTASMDKIDDRAQFKIEFQQVKQQVLATGNAITNITDNCCMKHHQDVNNDDEEMTNTGVTAPSKKVKTSRMTTPERQIYPSERSVEDCYEQSDSVEGKEDDGQPLLSSNDHDVEITHEDDDNPFIAKTGEGSMKCKVVLSWNHAIVNMVINNISEND